MQNTFLILFALVLSILPLHPYIASTAALGRRSWNELDLILGVILLGFYVYTFFTQRRNLILTTINLSFSLSAVLILTAATGYIFPVNYFEVFRFLIIIWLIPFIEYLLQSFNWKIIAFISLGILLIHAQWGIAQFILQHDIGLYVLGETRLSQTDTTGIANFNFSEDTKLIRAYGPYPHANSLSGSLIIGFLILLLLSVSMLSNYCSLLFKYNDSRHTTPVNTFFSSIPLSSIFYSIMFIILLGIIVTFSRSALLSLTLCIPFVFMCKRYLFVVNYKKIILTLMLLALTFSPLLFIRSTDPADVATSERVSGYTWTIELLTNTTGWQHVGPGQYKEALTKYLDTTEIDYLPWQIAPVHSVPLLLLAEWGLLATLLIFILFLSRILKYPKKRIRDYLIWIIPLLPPLLLDHYFLTQTAPLVWLVVLLMIYHQSLLKSHEIGLEIPSSD